MSKPISASDLPEDLARFAEAQVAAGRFESVEDVLRAGKEALENEQRLHERRPRRSEARKSLAQLFRESPLKGMDLAFVREQDAGRPVPQ